MNEEEMFEEINDDIGLVKIIEQYKCEYRDACKEKTYNCEFKKKCCREYLERKYGTY